jgi:cytochrome c peroxidase
MHDGSMGTLEEVFAHYQACGKENVNKSAHLKPFTLTEIEKNQLILFLKSLSDTRIKKHWEKVFNTRY